MYDAITSITRRLRTSGTMFTLVLASILAVSCAQECGRTSFSPTPNYAMQMIVGGQVANEGDFPWQVGLLENGILIGGGTYVVGAGGVVKVITAAHVLYGKEPFVNNYQVVFGMHNTHGGGTKRIVQAVNIKVHESYNQNNITHDIAVIGFGNLMPSALPVNTFPACRPTRTYTHNEYAVVSGWGSTSEDGSASTVLHYVWKPLISLAACEQTGNAGLLDSSMLCGGAAGKDACSGDSGGPLVAPRNGAWEVVGLVSWAFGCGRANFPGVYSDVWALRSWLNNNL
ncbi:trypsin alpha-3-like isoform X2 [Dreissena polymorpha]|uniref:trypsin alpha-3-like isoform X2 n=1 Tax=Dreissena polymorpha TaxID=45954 RepID=UPI002263D815|nr:trypsin alpha-3-like isoform X2 [Dreissena polymorpha]